MLNLPAFDVLILVLMEVGHRASRVEKRRRNGQSVLILVLMEYGLGLSKPSHLMVQVACLNPCFNGIWSRTKQLCFTSAHGRMSLNPCFNGIWSRTMHHKVSKPTLHIRLNPCSNGIWSRTTNCKFQMTPRKES